VLHLAASTHVDRSITDPMSFVLDNVVGTGHLLEWLRRRDQAPPFFYFSTDEVFGPAPPGVAYKEHDRYNSGNPYAAAKAGGEELCVAYANTYSLPIYITHTMNVIGERQHPEKFLPKVIARLLSGELIQVHANRERTQAGSRFYIYARNVSHALKFLVEESLSGRLSRGDKFNIVGEREISNEELVIEIARRLDVTTPNYELVDYHSSRPGHDLRYALDGSKLASMGCVYPCDFDEALSRIVAWYLANRSWLLL
jgi:dTDP-glucose 4,6-dehydratase